MPFSPRRMARRALGKALSTFAPAEVQTAVRFLRDRGGPAFPRKNVEVVSRPAEGAVLVLAPHPDDEAIGLGGTLALHVEMGSPVTVLYLTDGGGLGEDRSELIATRRAEAEAVGRSLGISQVFWDNQDTHLTNAPETVEALAGVLDEVAPATVYAPSIFDHHYDHFATTQVLVDALDRRPGLAVDVLGYEVWDAIPFPNYLVDVSSVVEKKDAILAHYATPHEATDFTGLCRQRCSVHFTLFVDSARERAGKGFAEAFLRFDGERFADLQKAWVDVLKKEKHPLVQRLAV